MSPPSFWWMVGGMVLAAVVLALGWRYLVAWWRKKNTENSLPMAAVLATAYVFAAAGVVISNPGAEHGDPKVANEQRRTVEQLAGGVLAAGGLVFAALRAAQTERQIKETQKQRTSGEDLKNKELLYGRWHKALDLLCKVEETDPHYESRVFAILMLSWLDLPPDQMQRVLETICNYTRINAKEPRTGDDSDKADEPMRHDLECAVRAICRITMRYGQPAEPMKLCGAYLAGATFQGADLGGWDLSGTILRHADFRGTILTKTVLNEADLSGAIFDESTTLVGTSLRGCTLNSLRARGVRFEKCDFVGVVTVSGADFQDCSFNGTDLDGVDMSLANIKQANFTGAIRYNAPGGTEPEPDAYYDAAPPLYAEDLGL